MQTYRVYYKGYYHELSEFKHFDVPARTEISALRKFFRLRKAELGDADLLYGADLPDVRTLKVQSEYRWWEGEWLEVYKGIEKVETVACPLCEGVGEVHKDVAQTFISNRSTLTGLRS
jgi:hypothetical protein